MSVASAPAGAEQLPRPPVRIRTVLLLALLAASVYWAYPRASAAWRLHAAATSFADYALCMAGPTGPTLLRDNPSEFRSVVRRRLVAADANERPFADCAKDASELTRDPAVERAHRATAWSFVEFGGAAADRAEQGRRGELSLDALAVSTRPVAELAQAAWPFVRGGYTRLLRPSLLAHEAVHPVKLAKPAVGTGLPAWRARYRAVKQTRQGYLLAVGKAANLSVFKSEDGGIHWTPAPIRGVDDFAERCSAGDRSYTFSLSAEGKNTLVTSIGAEAIPYAAALARADVEVVAASCDAQGLVAALRVEGKSEVALRLCPYRSRCRSLPLPRFGGVEAMPRFPLDVARVDGVTVLAVPMHGIVRVASTRDDGHTWTPFSVAFDRAEHPTLHVDVPIPERLLVLGKRVLLYGGAPQPAQTYSVLVSDDFGASWRSPETRARPIPLASSDAKKH